jgi:ATP-dependent RNA helicase RhlE
LLYEAQFSAKHSTQLNLRTAAIHLNIFKKIFPQRSCDTLPSPKNSTTLGEGHIPRKPGEEAPTFAQLGLDESLCRAVLEEGYQYPTPIQTAAIPHILAGKDILGCAQTGTGKTAAFSLPILHHLLKSGPRDRKVKALIVTPTRELAVQIKESFETYGKHSSLRVAVVFGGVGAESQRQTMTRGVDILVATPGRLLDLKQQGFMDFSELQFFVLDEADRMLDMGFLPDVKRIIAALPTRKQSLLFSATMPTEISALAMSLLSKPVKVEVAPISATADRIEQSLYFVNRSDKNRLLLHLVKGEEFRKVLVFTRTKATANRVVTFLQDHEVMAAAIHGNKSQNARQRALQEFRTAPGVSLLVASDLASRGIDVEGISHVINYDLPEVPETYVHRIGRTGRAEASGISLSFCSEDERAYLADIQKLIRMTVPVVMEHPYPPSFPTVAGGSRPQRSGGRGQRSPRQPSPQGGRQEAGRNHAGRSHQGGRSSNRGPSSNQGQAGDGPRRRPSSSRGQH